MVERVEAAVNAQRRVRSRTHSRYVGTLNRPEGKDAAAARLSFAYDDGGYERALSERLYAPISMDFYAATEGKNPVSPALVLRNGILIQGVDLSLTHGHSYSLVTSDRNVVNECYRISDNYVQTLPPLAERLGREAVLSSNLPFSYALQQITAILCTVRGR